MPEVPSEKPDANPGEVIQVTRTYLPPLEEYVSWLERVFTTGMVANRGPLVRELEEMLAHHLGIKRMLLTANGTIALQIILRLMGKGGEVITTPFSYVATASSIVWEHCKPVFVDIDPETLNIDAGLIEDAVTDRTTCILATHVFGNPCDVDVIGRIAERYGLSVIYDGAHAFGVRYRGRSLFEYGDAGICSFHATKVFHTGEGGGLVCRDPAAFEALYNMHNFGHKGTDDFHGIGINGKISELQAALGLAILPHMEDVIEGRRRGFEAYRDRLDPGKTRFQSLMPDTDWNYSYCPVLLPSETSLLRVCSALNREGVFPRRYFHPPLNRLPYLTHVPMPVAEKASTTILCLPLAHDMERSTAIGIAEIVNLNA